MAVPENKRFTPSAQPSTRKKRSTTKPHPLNPKHRNAQKRKKQAGLPPSLRYVETRHGKTTIRRYKGRSVYRMEETKGKLVECVNIFDSGDNHAISVVFQDETSITFSIEPGFNLFTEYADWKTGDWRCIKRWPLIRSQGLRLP